MIFANVARMLVSSLEIQMFYVLVAWWSTG